MQETENMRKQAFDLCKRGAELAYKADKIMIEKADKEKLELIISRLNYAIDDITEFLKNPDKALRFKED